MNKITQRIQPVMSETELAALIDDHYTAEAQTLTTGAEANLLKLAELRDTLTTEQQEAATRRDGSFRVALPPQLDAACVEAAGLLAPVALS